MTLPASHLPAGAAFERGESLPGARGKPKGLSAARGRADRRRIAVLSAGLPRAVLDLQAWSSACHSLEEAGIIERSPNSKSHGWEYNPTTAGRELEEVLNQLGIWAQHWIELRQEHCDAAYLMQTVHALIRPEQLRRTGVTVRFEFAHESKVYWLVLEGQKSELCFNDPGREVDLLVTSDERSLGAVLLGRATLADQVRSGKITFDGPTKLIRDFPNWIGVTRYARYATPTHRAYPAVAAS